jgi:branched-chain amino acid transport system permease protein
MNANSEQRRKERLDRGIKVRSDGIYALMSFRELCYLVLPRSVLIVGMLILPLVVPTYWQKVVSYVCIYALLTLSFDFLAHFVGLVSLGGAFFVGTGGYLAAILNTYLGFPPILSIPIATILGAFICTLLLLPCLPLRGVYFAIVTLMYPLLLTRVIEALDILGGTDGMMGITSFSNHYFIIIMVLLFLFGIRRLVNR